MLLDLHLPDISGEQVLRRLKADPATADIKVVVVSADATTDAANRLRQLGAADYITKPFDIPRILEIIDNASEPDTRRATEPADRGSSSNTASPSWRATPDVEGTLNGMTDNVVEIEVSDADLSGFVHDLINNLGVIVNYSRLLLRSALPAAMLADIEEINTAAQRAAREAANYLVNHPPRTP